MGMRKTGRCLRVDGLYLNMSLILGSIDISFQCQISNILLSYLIYQIRYLIFFKMSYRIYFLYYILCSILDI